MELDLVAELEALIDALAAADIDYALCGALALAVHGYPRATKDIDLLLPADQIGRTKAVAARLGFDLPALPMTFDHGTSKERVVHRVSKAHEASKTLIALDLLQVEPSFGDVWRDRQRVRWGARTLVAVSRDGLILMKRMAGRTHDLADIEALEQQEP